MLRVHAISSSELIYLATKVKGELELSERFLTTVAFWLVLLPTWIIMLAISASMDLEWVLVSLSKWYNVS